MTYILSQRIKRWLRNQRLLRGDVVLLSAQPLPVTNTKLVHDIVVKYPVNHCCLFSIVCAVPLCYQVRHPFCAAEEDSPASG